MPQKTMVMINKGYDLSINFWSISNCSLQLCASVQVPKILGGLNAEAIYINTNSNFSFKRFKGMSYSMIVGSVFFCDETSSSRMVMDKEMIPVY